MQNPFGNNNQDFFNNLPIPPNYAKIINDQGDIRSLWVAMDVRLTIPRHFLWLCI